MNDNEEDLDSTIRHAKALTWVCVALFVVLDVIGLTAPSQSDPRFVLGGLWWGRVLLGYHWRGCLVGLLGLPAEGPCLGRSSRS